MSKDAPERGRPLLPMLSEPQEAEARIGIAAARVRVTPAGLLAIGGLVSAILLSVPPIIRAARERR